MSRTEQQIRADLAELATTRANGCAPYFTNVAEYQRLVLDVEPLLDRLAEVERVRVGIMINVEAGQQVSGQGVLEMLGAAVGGTATPADQGEQR